MKRGVSRRIVRTPEDGCVGQVSEIFDGQLPHRPRGCFAEAWSVAEPLRALIEDVGVLREGASSSM